MHAMTSLIQAKNVWQWKDQEMKNMVEVEKEEERTRKGGVEDWKAATQH